VDDGNGNINNNNIRFYSPQDEDEHLLSQIYSRIEDIKYALQKEKNRLKQPSINTLHENSCEKSNYKFDFSQSIKRNIDFLTNEIEILKDEIKKIIINNKELNIIYTVLTSRNGIKDDMTLMLLARLHELGKIERKQLCSLCGVAPVPYESGSSVKGHRYTMGGRKAIKAKLYLCAMSMIRYNQQFKDKLDELVSKGKNKKIALIALAKKLIIQLNAMVRNALVKDGIIESRIETRLYI
jgi:transposase